MADKSTHHLFQNNQELVKFLKASRIFEHSPENLIHQLLPLSDLVSFPENTHILTEVQQLSAPQPAYSSSVFFI